MKNTTIFVYGTLRNGFNNHFLLHSAKFLGEAVTEPKYNLVGDGIPFLISGDKSVVGEVYSVTPEELLDLDYLEGHPNGYTRLETKVKMVNSTNGEYIEVEAYHWRHPTQYTETYTDYKAKRGR